LVAGYLQRDGDRSWAVRANAMKLVVGTAPLPLLFDLGADPAETQAAMFAPPVLTAALLGLPAALALDVGETSERDGTGAAAASNGSRTEAASRQNRKQTNMDADLKNELRALGYVE
jgi:hypothetical protein